MRTTTWPSHPTTCFLGRAANRRDKSEAKLPAEEDDPADDLTIQQAIAEEWWKTFSQTAFEQMVPRSKWRQVVRNVCEGDVVLVKYDGKMSKNKYRIALVVCTYPDAHGNVRTVKIKMRSRDIREPALPYK